VTRASRTIAITGASRGLGAGLARHFRARGHRLALCSRSPAELGEAEDVLVRQLDVSDAEAVGAFARDAAERFGTLDLWINNAGVLEPIQPLRDLDPEEARRHAEINLMGVVFGSQAYIRHVRARGGPGALINISSGAARKPYAGWSMYCASKAAVDRLTECIAVEEKEIGLRAWSVAPGVIDTDMQALIRSTSVEDFPQHPRFVEMKRRNEYNGPDFIADRLLALAFGHVASGHIASLHVGNDDVLVRLPNEWEEAKA